MKFRIIYLLIASYFFYINIKPIYVLLLIGITGSTYLFTLLMHKAKKDSIKLKLMRLNIFLILLPLFFFKYFGVIDHFVVEKLINLGFHLELPNASWFLPVGISFYTFMAIGYTVDVYNEEVEVEKDFSRLALFISFFPLVLSGPIERAKIILPQFSDLKPIDYSNISNGLKLILWGYFMKLVVADRLGIYVDAVYSHLEQHNGNSILFASILYPFQLYADLGGYSLIAIGVAKSLGFEVIQNFKRPFFASSMAEFWRRWHISLIKWLTDYVYTPLSFFFRSYRAWGIVMALMVTFLISGIWHGASMTFVFWGGIQGLYLSIEALSNNKRLLLEKKYNLQSNRFYILICIVVTFCLFAISQVFGKVQSVEEAFYVFQKVLTDRGPLYLDLTTLSYSLFGLSLLMMKDFFDEYYQTKLLFFENKSIFIRFTSYIIILLIILYIGVLNGGQFIYFQY